MWTWFNDAYGKSVIEVFHGFHSYCRYSHPTRKCHPIEVRPVEVKHIPRARTGVLGPNIGKFVTQAGIGMVREYDSRYIEALSSLGPQRLKRVHSTTISLQGDHFALGTGDSRTRRERHSNANRSARVVQPVVLAT